MALFFFYGILKAIFCFNLKGALYNLNSKLPKRTVICAYEFNDKNCVESFASLTL